MRKWDFSKLDYPPWPSHCPVRTLWNSVNDKTGCGHPHPSRATGVHSQLLMLLMLLMLVPVVLVWITSNFEGNRLQSSFSLLPEIRATRAVNWHWCSSDLAMDEHPIRPITCVGSVVRWLWINTYTYHF